MANKIIEIDSRCQKQAEEFKPRWEAIYGKFRTDVAQLIKDAGGKEHLDIKFNNDINFFAIEFKG